MAPRGTLPAPVTDRRLNTLLLQPEQLPPRLQPRLPAAFGRLLGPRRNGAVQELVLQQPERSFDVGAVFLAELAVEPIHELPHDGLPLRLEVLCQPGDDWPMSAARPVLQKTALLLFDNRLRRADVLEPLVQRPLTDTFEIVNVEKTRLVAVVDARSEIARHGDGGDHHLAR